MNFVKGIITGATIGTIVGVMNSDSIMTMVRKGKRQLNKARRRYKMM